MLGDVAPPLLLAPPLVLAPPLLVLPLLVAPPLLLMPPLVDPLLPDFALPACSGAAACSSRESLPSPFLSSLAKSLSCGVPFASSFEMKPSLFLSRALNIASDAARVGSSGEAPYSACKGGIVALTKTLARELAGKGVRLNVVCPGLTETGMLESFMQGAGNPDKLREAYRRAIPLGRLGRPDDIAGAVLFLASDDADFITGQVLSVSGGLTMHG